MNLPNYFIADLPPEAVLTPKMISEACVTLKRNRERYLMNRRTEAMITALCETAQNWLEPTYRLRQFVLEQGPAQTGFSKQTLAGTR